MRCYVAYSRTHKKFMAWDHSLTEHLWRAKISLSQESLEAEFAYLANGHNWIAKAVRLELEEETTDLEMFR